MPHPIRKLLTNIGAHRAETGPIKSLSNEALIAEWHHWDDKIRNAVHWGAAVAATNEFRKECENRTAPFAAFPFRHPTQKKEIPQ